MPGRPLSKRQQDFLRLWSECGRGRMSIRDFCKRHGYPKQTVYQWRTRDAALRDAMDGHDLSVPRVTPRDETEVEIVDEPGEVVIEQGVDRIAKLAAERWPNLSAWQGEYLEVWRETVDRDTACRHVKKEWREVRESRKKSKRFEAACREIEEVFKVRVEDAEERAAIAGRAASTGRYLEAKNSKLAKSAGKEKKGDEGTSEDPRKTAERYAEIFKAHQSRGAGKDLTN